MRENREKIEQISSWDLKWFQITRHFSLSRFFIFEICMVVYNKKNKGFSKFEIRSMSVIKSVKNHNRYLQEP